MDAKIFRINYKSDFILTLTSDAGWMTPFCIKFWTGAPSQAYYVSWDGETYTHCIYDPSEPTKLTVQFDDHHLPIGDLKFQVAYHFTVADFPNDTEDEVINQANITTEIDGETYKVMLDFTGETAPEIQFSLPAYANEAQRIANEQQRIANEQQRIANEQQRIQQENARVEEFNSIKNTAQSDHRRAESDHSTAVNDHTRAESDHRTAADDHTQAGNDHTRAESDHTQAGNDHTRAESDHTQAGNDHTRAESDHTQAGNDHTRAESDHTQAGNDHTRAESDHTQAGNDHTRAESDHTRAENDHAAVEVFIDSLGAFDISAYHASGGVLAKYADLQAALGTGGANIPESLRKGGMSVKFVQTDDNKYVQYRLMATSFSTSDTDWQGVDDEPTAGSSNLVKSGGIAKELIQIKGGYNNITLNLEDIGHYISSSNKWQSDNAHVKGATAVFSNYAGKSVKVTANSNSYAFIALLARDYNSSQTTPVFATGYSGRISIAPNDSVEINVPSNCSYIYIQTLGDDIDRTPSDISEHEIGLIKTEIKNATDDTILFLSNDIFNCEKEVTQTADMYVTTLQKGFVYTFNVVSKNNDIIGGSNSGIYINNVLTFRINDFNTTNSFEYTATDNFNLTVRVNNSNDIGKYLNINIKSNILPTAKYTDIFDISMFNSLDGLSPISYSSLSDAIAAMPAFIKVIHGVSIKYVDDNTNKYVQYRLASPSWSASTSDWVKCDSENTGVVEIDCWGDSLTQSSTGIYPNELAEISHLTVNNYGDGGEATLHIAGRHGGCPACLKEEVTIPATGSVVVSLKSTFNDWDFSNGSYFLRTRNSGINPCRIGDVVGELSYSANGILFTRSESGSAQTVKAGELIYPRWGINTNNHVQVIWIGQNVDGSFSTNDELVKIVKNMVQYYNNKNFLAVCFIQRNAGVEYVVAAENAYKKAFGIKSFCPREYLNYYGIEKAIEKGYIQGATTQDELDIAAGLIPSSLRSDAVHLNTYGYKLVAQRIYELIVQNGYLT